ncbi:MAG: tripartite tricarboxylate transporter TctB family protein [Pseudomonadota bacterium]
MRRAELLWAAMFLVIAAIVIGESVRLGFGWEEYGPQAGFAPFWIGVLLLLSGGAVLLRGLRMKGSDNFFVNRQGMWEASRIFLTSIMVTVGIVYLGVYIATIFYTVLFSRWLGRHRWPAVIAFAVITTLVVFYGMEKGLRIPMPKSPLYQKGWFIF